MTGHPSASSLRPLHPPSTHLSDKEMDQSLQHTCTNRVHVSIRKTCLLNLIYLKFSGRKIEQQRNIFESVEFKWHHHHFLQELHVSILFYFSFILFVEFQLCKVFSHCSQMGFCGNLSDKKWINVHTTWWRKMFSCSLLSPVSVNLFMKLLAREKECVCSL